MENIDLKELNNIPYQKWGELASKKIFFAHQSVGSNIIEGIEDIMNKIPAIKIVIKETNNPNDFEKPVFGHFRVGKNLDPYIKSEEFKKVLINGVGNKVDYAFLKFCYVDIKEETDVDKIFEYYFQTFDELQKTYPNVKFIHFTVPLTSSEPTNSMKAMIKRILKKNFREEEDNIKRNLFNNKLIEKFGKENNVFDLAKYESQYPSRRLNIFNKNGLRYYSLVPEYTDDGGHLNKTGRKWIAEKLLIFLLLLEKI